MKSPENSPPEAGATAWWFELIHQGPLVPWTLLALCSANRAKMAQSFVRNNGIGSDGPVDLRDSEATRKWLTHKVAQYPDALVDHWVLIQRELFKDLLGGSNAFARNLAKKRKSCQNAVSSAREALKSGDKKQFTQAMDGIFSENPHGYADQVDRFLVEHWTVRPESDLPPFCCWKDEAMAEYLSERFKIAIGSGANFIDDRRSSLGLLKIPAYVVREWYRGSDGMRGRPGYDLSLRDNPKPDQNAFRWICGRLDIEVFRDAFPSDDEMLQYGQLFLGFPTSEEFKTDIMKRITQIKSKEPVRIHIQD